MDLINIAMGQTDAKIDGITTGSVAAGIGVCRATLYRWLRLGFIAEPAIVQVGRLRIRVWQQEDVIRALNHRNQFFYWTRDQIKRGTLNGTQPGAERRSGDERAEGTGAPPLEIIDA
jgi:hypothetical protein